MNRWLLPLHLVLVGAWLGCVLTEAFFERALLGKGRDQELALAQLHWRVDLLIEIPLFALVALSGVLMLGGAPAGAVWHAKLGFAALALVSNAYCVWLVYRRLGHARAGQWDAFARVDHLQHKVGALVLAGIVGALGCGLLVFAARY